MIEERIASMPRILRLTLPLALAGLLMACPSRDDDDAVGSEPPPEPEAALTCEQCHTDEEMLLATVEPPEEPDGETEGSGEG